MSSGLFYHNSLGPVHFQYKRCLVVVYYYIANNVDRDQMLRSSVSDLGLHCLPLDEIDILD